MRVLVVSDSHGMIGRLENILMAAEAEGPLDAVIHLGDGYCDLDEFAQNGLPPRYQVAGNCDLGRDGQQEIITLSGARLLLTHGHRYQVRQGVESLLGEKCQGLLGDLEDTLALKLAYRHALLGKEAILGCVLAQLEHGRILEIWFFSHKCFINVFV